MVRQPRIEFAEACHHALSRTYTYDGNNRLLSATVGTNSATFTHDARMRNIKRIVGGQPRYFYFDGWSLVQERDGSGNVVQNYVNGPRIDDPRSLGRLGGEPAIAGPGRARLGRSRASQIVRKTDGGGTVYYHADALGSVVALTDHTGDVVERYTYDVFGAPAIFDGTGSGISATAYDNRFLFTGREWIEELELYDYRNRIYSPGLGRFLQTDPIRFRAGDANLYRYASNSSVNRKDPLGLFSLTDDLPTLDDEPPGWPLDEPFDFGGEEEPPTPPQPPPTSGGYIAVYDGCEAACDEPNDAGKYLIICLLRECLAGECPGKYEFYSEKKDGHGEVWDAKQGYDPFEAYY